MTREQQRQERHEGDIAFVATETGLDPATVRRVVEAYDRRVAQHLRAIIDRATTRTRTRLFGA